MKDSKRNYGMEAVYKEIGKSRQQFDQQVKRDAQQVLMESAIIDRVKDWRTDHRRIGSRALYYSMKHAGITLGIGVTKFEQLMSFHGLTQPKIKKYGPKTSDGKGKADYKNLTNGLKLRNINVLVVGDITYFWLESRWHYVFTLKDVYSQYILSLKPARTMEAKTAISALLEAEQIRGKPNLKSAIHHSDNGSQYECSEYKSHIFRLKMKISRADNCQQNGSAEQLNHIAKNMYLHQWAISSFKELEQACKEVQYLNNHQRAIQQLGYRTPAGFENYISSLPIEKRPKKELYDFNQHNKN